MKCKCIKVDPLKWLGLEVGKIYDTYKKGNVHVIEGKGLGFGPLSFKEMFEPIEEQRTMETKELYLYKVMLKVWSDPIYVAAENQQQAIEKIKGSFDVDVCTLNIEYVDMVTV